jgi:hypothetical protein
VTMLGSGYITTLLPRDVRRMSTCLAAMVSQGKTLEEVFAAKPTADFDGQVAQGAQSSERFVKWLYAEVKAQQH